MGEERLREHEEAMERVKELVVRNIENLWIEYDKHNDILYINFSREEPDESILVDEDVTVSIRDGRELVSITIMNFSRRAGL